MSYLDTGSSTQHGGT